MKAQRFLFFSLGFVLLVIVSLFAKESEGQKSEYGWRNEIIGTLNLTQASFDNWTRGGENTLAWQVNLNSTFALKQEKFIWVNSAKFKFGLTKVGDTEARKSADEIKLESVYTRKIGDLLGPFVSFKAQSQFTKGFDYDGDDKTAVSKFLDPGYFTQSFGLAYVPNSIFKTRFGAAIKETITSDFPDRYADNPDTPNKIEKTKIEPGISSITEFKMKFEENVILTSKLDLFSDLEAFNRIDVLWENALLLKVTKFIYVSLNIDLFYDRDASKRHQLKQLLALGFSYTFL